MTGRTHDLAAFTALNAVFAFLPGIRMSFPTLMAVFGANMIGGLLPDIDNETSDIWDKIRGGSVLARIIKPLVGHHRMVSHSLAGMAFAGLVLKYVLSSAGSVILVDMTLVWWAVMIGYASHLFADSLTTEGVPWLFPIPFRFGFPPVKFLRIKTGGLAEKIVVFPALLAANGFLVYANYPAYLTFIRGFLRQ